jgi:hypothetical protein
LKSAHGSTNRCKLGIPIGAKGNCNKDYCCPDVNWDCQDIAHQRVVAHAPQDGWKESTEPVEEDILTKLNDTTEKQFGITHCNAHLFPAEIVTSHVLATLLIAHPHHPSFFFVEEICFSWVVGQAEPD